jgi:hypothetical protein
MMKHESGEKLKRRNELRELALAVSLMFLLILSMV